MKPPENCFSGGFFSPFRNCPPPKFRIHTRLMISFLFSSALLGLMAGISPGPLLTLVVTQTVRFGPKEGVRVACCPLLTDLPVIGAVLFFVSRLSETAPLMGLLSLIGAVYLGYLAFETWYSPTPKFSEEGPEPRSLIKGVTANLLNPHVYLFWLSVGVPLIVDRSGGLLVNTLLFAIPFYLLLIGSKVSLALLLGRYGFSAESPWYGITLKIMATTLTCFALFFLRDGMAMLATIAG